MQLQKASKKKAKIKMAMQGPSGSGKTMSSLLLAYGLCGDWSKIAIIDTENNSASLYADIGCYNIIELAPPFSPEKYIEAIQLCEKEDIEVIIIDSISHEWEGSGGIINIHSNMVGNSFTNWAKLTPRHNLFVQTILQSKAHVICTIRVKQDYILVERNGKQVPEKVGLKGITRDGIDYEFTIVFDIDMKHTAIASKDRTSLFIGKPHQLITSQLGKAILDWCNSGSDFTVDDISVKISKTNSIQELLSIYHMFPQFKEVLKNEYESQKRNLLMNRQTTNQLQNQKLSSNGAITN
ncbi:MAG: AAA family ATPase [Bacteroidetes bacterium]|nr:AAA family ATPase [Bacteroidota bacterium]